MLAERPDLCERFVHLYSLLQNLHPNKRMTLQHVEYESQQWLSGFHILEVCVAGVLVIVLVVVWRGGVGRMSCVSMCFSVCVCHVGFPLIVLWIDLSFS